MKEIVMDSDIPANLHIKTKGIKIKKILLSPLLHPVRNKNASLLVVILNKNVKQKPGKSLMRKLLNTSPYPVLFISREDPESEPSVNKDLFSHTIFATDWSAASEKALHLILSLKEILGELEIVNIINKKLTIKDIRDLKEKMADTRKKFLDENIDAEAHIYAGKTHVEILTAAKDYKGTIIITGTSRKKHTVNGFFTGSTIFKVVENAAIPVIVIP